MWVLYILGFCLYLGYLAVCIPASAAVAFVAYAIGVPGAYVAGLGKVLATRPPELPAPRRRPKSPPGSDPAVLQYFYGPALADADHVLQVGFANCRKLWELGVDAAAESFDADDAAWFTAPLGVGRRHRNGAGDRRRHPRRGRLGPGPAAGRGGLGRPSPGYGSHAAGCRFGHARGEERQDGVPALL